MDADKFWARVQKSDSGCWRWKGATTGGGYGELKIDGRVLYAHRVAYTLTFGEIPDLLNVCHSCDNRLCCNPNHLFTGTHLENMHDMYEKGRSNIQGVHRELSEDISELTESIREHWIPGMSGRQIGRLLGKPYAGSWYKKINQIIALLSATEEL